MEAYSNYYKKVFSVIYYVTILLLLVSCGRNESKEEKHSTFEYAKMALQIYPAQTEISSSDAKFMNNHIIVGVGGNLNIMNLDRSVLAEFPDIEVNWIDSIDEDGLVIYGNSERQIGIAQIDYFMVFFEYEDYDKGCSAIKVIESLDSEGREWGEPTELLPNDADHEMASIWKEGDNYILWYSCDKNSVGESYMKGQIFYAVFDKNWELISKDIEVAEDYRDIGGVSLYEVNRINDKITFLYAKDYLTNNELSVLQEK